MNEPRGATRYERKYAIRLLLGPIRLPEPIRRPRAAQYGAEVQEVLASAWTAATTTKPGRLFKQHIPVRTFTEWTDVHPGFLEADLVAHCGGSMGGAFLYTLTLTDVGTTWTECLPLLLLLLGSAAGGRLRPLRR